MSATGTDTEVTRPRAGVNPYVGPRSLQEGEAIYGRMREIAELRGLLVAHRIVLLYSPSGAGKTSLIEAGLRPELQRRKFYVLPTIRVGYELSSDAAQGTANRYRASVIASLEERLPPERQLGAKELASIGLDVYLEQLDQEHPDQNPCLIFDQFEELFTLDPVDFDAKAEFLDELGLALSNRTRWALFAMREDFIAQLDPYLSSIPTGFNTRFRIGLLDPKEAKQAAKAPAAAAGVDFEDAAVDQLIEDLRQIQVQRMGKTSVEPGPNVEPVQLQVVCRRLWAHLDPEATTIGTKDAMSAGDVNEALAGYYVDEVEAVTKTGVSEKALRQWFDSQLISDDGYRNQVRTGPGKSGSEVLTDLEDAHLIRADRRRGTDWYELTHDRFVEPIRNSNRDFNARRRTKYLRRGLIAAAIVFGAVLLFVPSLFSSEGLKAEPLATDGSTVVIDLDESGVARYLFNAEARDEVVATVSSENGTVAVEIRLWVAGGELRHLAYGVRLTDLPLDTSKNEKDQAGQSLAGVEEDSKSTIQVSTLEYQFVADGEFVIEVTSTPSAKLMLESRVTEGGEFSNLDDIGADTATLSTPGDVRTYQLSAQNDNETISLTLTPTDELRGLAKIVNAQGTEINSADAAGSGESVQLVTELLTAGTYYVQVSGVDGSTGGYTLALEKGTEAEDATLSLGTPLAGSIDTEEVDEYPFEASAGQYLELSVVPTGGFDVAIEVAGPQGFFDFVDSGGEGAPEVLVLAPTVDVSYLISVRRFLGSGGDYTITLEPAN